MKAKARSEDVDDVGLWNREDASELERPTQPKEYGITVASRDWTVETIVRQVEPGRQPSRSNHISAWMMQS